MKELVNELFQELRNRIDSIDRSLVQILEERMQIVSKISDLKARHSMSVLDAGREKLVLENVVSHIQNHELDPYMIKIFEEVMANSRNYQKSRIAAIPNGSKHFGLLGGKLSHSLSPQIHQAIFRNNHMKATYSLVERNPDMLAQLLPELKAEGYSGINVTIPYKTDIMRYLHDITPEAKHIGAVNTIVLGDQFIGHNTDYTGFGLALTRQMPSIAGKKAAVLGTGGASKAVVAWLEDNGIQALTIVSRDIETASIRYPGLPSATLHDFSGAGYDIIVNTTPVGMYPHENNSPLTEKQLIGAGFVMDLVYNPKTTMLMKKAKQLNIPCENGLTMLVAQAIAAEEIWHHRKFNADQLDAILDEISKLL